MVVVVKKILKFYDCSNSLQQIKYKNYFLLAIYYIIVCSFYFYSGNWITHLHKTCELATWNKEITLASF